MAVENEPLAELRHRGIAALVQALGPVGMARFLQQFDTGSGDYTRDRHAWLPATSVEDLAEEIERERGGP